MAKRLKALAKIQSPSEHQLHILHSHWRFHHLHQSPLLSLPPSISVSVSLLSITLDSLGNCLTSFQSMKTFLQRLRAMRITIGSHKRKSCRSASKLELSTSHFASMEVSNQFKQVFKVIDSNGDGRISTLELGEVLLCLGHEKSMALEEAERMVGEMDCNGDGLIELDEFMDVMNSGGKAGVDENEEDHLLDAFLIYDIDKNGLISPKELQRVLISLGCDKCSLEECRRMIKAVDKDGDGFVDFEDFRSMMTASAY